MRGREIKRRLEDNELTQKWLMKQLHQREFPIDYTRLSHVLNEQVTGGKVEETLSMSADIIADYEKRFLGASA